MSKSPKFLFLFIKCKNTYNIQVLEPNFFFLMKFLASWKLAFSLFYFIFDILILIYFLYYCVDVAKSTQTQLFTQIHLINTYINWVLTGYLIRPSIISTNYLYSTPTKANKCADLARFEPYTWTSCKEEERDVGKRNSTPNPC